MNTLLIGLLVIVILVAVGFAVSYITSDYLIRDSTKLNTNTNSPVTIEPSQIDSPGSSRYYYEGWFYIKSNQTPQNENIIFNRGGDFIVTLKGSTLNLYVNADSNKIMSTGAFNSSGLTPLISIPNFPFQKWAQLVINVDGMSVDMYIDGRFVKNILSPNIISSNAHVPITYGNQFTVGSFARFRRPAISINPQGVWNHYMQGSGQDQSLTNYHLNAIVTKNERQTLNQRLF